MVESIGRALKSTKEELKAYKNPKTGGQGNDGIS